MDKRENIIGKVKDYQELVKQSNFPMPIEAVYLFGSYAKGTANKDSDIDVALVVNSFDGDYFDVIPPIWLLRESIDFRIEPHVIARDADYAGFLDEIQRTGILIN
jgi:predicted nucleotidyltransferase